MAFDALEVSLQFLARVSTLEEQIRKRSASLAAQLADAGDSMALNVGEGRGRRGGDQRRHYTIASGSCVEATTALRVAVARRYITQEQLDEIDPLLDRLRAMLYRLAR